MLLNLINTPRKRKITPHLIAGMFNVGSMALYLESPNEFGQHYGWINHHLTQFNNTGEKVGFTVIALFTALLGYSNQISYTKWIGKIIPNPEETPLIQPTKKSKQPLLNKFLAGISSFYKAAVASTSLSALLKSQTNPSWAWSFSSICFFGSFMAQFSILSEHLTNRIHWSDKKRWTLAHFLTLCYNIPNAALYFNAGDAFLRTIQVLDHRLIDGPDAWEYSLVTLLTISSVFLLISTQRSYSKKIADIFTNHDEKETILDSQIEYNLWDHCINTLTPFFKIEAGYTTVYKSVINYISLVALLFNFCPLPLSLIIATFIIPGNLYAQYSILKPELSKKQIFDNILEPKISTPCCFGLFPQFKADNTSDLEVTRLDLIKP